MSASFELSSDEEDDILGSLRQQTMESRSSGTNSYDPYGTNSSSNTDFGRARGTASTSGDFSAMRDAFREAGLENLSEETPLGGGGGGGGGGGAAGGAQAGSPAQSAETMFKYLDKDKDGKLSQAEMASTMEKANAAAKARGEQEFDFFEKLDVDNDGFVDRGEADEFFKMMGLPTGKEEL